MFPFFRKEHARVVFSSDYIYGLPSAGERQTFDIMRFKKIRDRLVKERLLSRKNILRPELCSYHDLYLVHSKPYIKKLQNPLYASQLLNLDAINLFYESILEYYRAVTGGTLLATAQALKWNVPVFNLGGGYHHAHPERAEGFCLINDVAVAIEKIRKIKPGLKFMIIDLDYHQGNGNLLYFKDDPDVYTFSMHAETWVEIERPQNKDILLPVNCDEFTYMTILEKELPLAWEEFTPDAVFYIAGSDPYIKDTLADMNISRQGMLRRNLFVYKMVRSSKVPLIILAGGGYGQDSWEIYYDFIYHVLKNRFKNKKLV